MATWNINQGDLSTGTKGLISGSIQFRPDTKRMIPPNKVASAKVMVLRRTNSRPARTVAQATYTIVSYELLQGAYPPIYHRIPIPYM